MRVIESMITSLESFSFSDLTQWWKETLTRCADWRIQLIWSTVTHKNNVRCKKNKRRRILLDDDMEDSDELCPSDGLKISVPFHPQRYNWDCGLACSCMVLRFLNKNCNTVYSSDLKWLQCGESVWTIHLALLMKLHRVRHHFCTLTLGVDKHYAKQSYYKDRFSEDERQVNRLFESAEEKGISVEKRSVELAEILEHLIEGNILICLIDYSVLASVSCFKETCTLLKCFGNCINYYQGHFIVVCGYNKIKRLIYYMNPNISHEEICRCSMEVFDMARKQYGTDEDLLFIYRD